MSEIVTALGHSLAGEPIDQDERVRSVAAAVLGQLGDPEAIPFLVAALSSDPAPSVREACAQALGKIGQSPRLPEPPVVASPPPQSGQLKASLLILARVARILIALPPVLVALTALIALIAKLLEGIHP